MTAAIRIGQRGFGKGMQVSWLRDSAASPFSVAFSSCFQIVASSHLLGLSLSGSIICTAQTQPSRSSSTRRPRLQRATGARQGSRSRSSRRRSPPATHPPPWQSGRRPGSGVKSWTKVRVWHGSSSGFDDDRKSSVRERPPDCRFPLRFVMAWKHCCVYTSNEKTEPATAMPCRYPLCSDGAVVVEQFHDIAFGHWLDPDVLVVCRLDRENRAAFNHVPWQFRDYSLSVRPTFENLGFLSWHERAIAERLFGGDPADVIVRRGYLDYERHAVILATRHHRVRKNARYSACGEHTYWRAKRPYCQWFRTPRSVLKCPMS